MKKFNLFVSLKGGAGTMHNIPNTKNPIEAESLQQALRLIADIIPENGSIEWVGIRIVKIPEE